jgi:hypothetical protein
LDLLRAHVFLLKLLVYEALSPLKLLVYAALSSLKLLVYETASLTVFLRHRGAFVPI